MQFKELQINDTFEFSDPVGYSIGREFVKVSARCYMNNTSPFSDDADERQLHDLEGHHKFQVGTITVDVSKS